MWIAVGESLWQAGGLQKARGPGELGLLESVVQSPGPCLEVEAGLVDKTVGVAWRWEEGKGLESPQGTAIS